MHATVNPPVPASPRGSAESTNAEPTDANPRANDAAGPSKRQGVRVTATAVEYAKERLKKRGTPEAAIRLGVKGGGCSGFNYVIEFSDDAPRSRDTVSEFGGVTFYVDKKSLLYLNGSTLEYVNTVMYQGFKFLNPQEASSCGCGHSFTVK